MTKELKHTPGPWFTMGLTVLSEKPPIRVAKVISSGMEYDQAEADARLIAAAPELLDALKSLLVFAIHMHHKHGHDLAEQAFDQSATDIETGLEAVEKAGGKV